MKKKKILAILALSMIISSSSFMGVSEAFAATTATSTGGVLSLNIGQAGVPNLQEIMGHSSDYYYNGFPSTVEVETRQFSSNNVVFDYVQPDADRDYSRVTVPAPGYHDDISFTFDDLKVKGYITVDDRVVQTYQEALTAAKNKGIIKKGEKVMSIILQEDSPYIDAIKVERSTYFTLLREEGLAPNSSSNIETSRTYGVTNEQAYSIAKTIGMEFSAGLGFSKGPLSAEVGYKLQSSLTETFSSSYSVTDSTTETYTHNFGISDINRRVALYQYVESYKSIPTLNPNNEPPAHIKDNLVPASHTNYKTNRVQSVSITQGDFVKSNGTLDSNSDVQLTNVYRYGSSSLKFSNNGQAIFDLGTSDELKLYDVKIEYENKGTTDAVLDLGRRNVGLKDSNLEQIYIDALYPWATDRSVTLNPTNGEIKTLSLDPYTFYEQKDSHNYLKALLKTPSNGDLIIHKITLTRK